MDSFRFSPNINLADRIDWHPWGEEAFAKAQAENKPVLLSISAVWCHWCHVMDETSYSDPDVQRILNENFVCIRADNDRRPDLNARYNVGGWPTTAFLTGHGGLIGGATYLPPDQFLAMLGELQRAYLEEKSPLYDQARELLSQRQERAGKVCAGPEVEVAFADRVARSLAGAYDAVNGGVGVAPKFPNGPILQYLVHLTRTTGEEFYRAMLEKTLDRMASGPLYDPEEGGFFRNSANPDWSDPQLEKMLEDNVSLARVYLDAYPLLHNDRYHRVASQTVDYLIGNLYDPEIPGFHGSQGAHSEYFSLPLSGRRDQEPPAVDQYCYTSSNAQAVSLCLHAAWRLARTDLTDVALAVLDHIDQGAESGNLSHVYDGTGPGHEPTFLVDWAHLLVALVDAHACTGRQHYLDRAKAVVRELVDRFFDETNGAFFDTEKDSQAIGYLRVREKPLAENMAAVTGLLKLHQATWDADYRQIAETTLSAFADSYHESGEHGAEYGQAVDLLKNSPVEVTVEGNPSHPSTQAMLAAAARLPSPNLVIKTLLVDGSQISAQAHVCLDTLCLPPVEDPDLLADTVSSMTSPQASPFENILERLPGI
ncbi:MAG: thioredoxin domain-containing protein [Chloroflexi bacterium]|nr:thioredoxin domain-containing protein [Chloroflexota bacterium]